MDNEAKKKALEKLLSIRTRDMFPGMDPNYREATEQRQKEGGQELAEALGISTTPMSQISGLGGLFKKPSDMQDIRPEAELYDWRPNAGGDLDVSPAEAAGVATREVMRPENWMGLGGGLRMGASVSKVPRTKMLVGEKIDPGSLGPTSENVIKEINPNKEFSLIPDDEITSVSNIKSQKELNELADKRKQEIVNKRKQEIIDKEAPEINKMAENLDRGQTIPLEEFEKQHPEPIEPGLLNRIKSLIRRGNR